MALPMARKHGLLKIHDRLRAERGRIAREMDGMTIEAILQGKGDDVVSLSRDATVGQAVALLAEKRIGAVPVIDGGSVVGIFSERDVIHCLASHGADALALPLGAVMTRPVQSVAPTEKVIGALSLMTRRRIRHLPGGAG